jgi:hypothetical protein
VLPASRSFLKSVRRNLPPHPSRPPVTLTAHLRLKGPWMRFDASERPRCTALHCHQTCGRRFREDSAHHHAGTAMRGLSHFAILGRHCLCVARHERGRANAYRRHQSRNALQNSFPLAEETSFTDCTLITAMPRVLLLFRRLVHLQVSRLHVPKPASQRTCARDRHLKQEAER